jgi:hypothetical protein
MTTRVTTADEIQAAIEKLNELRNSRGYYIENGWLVEIDNSLLPEDPRVPLTSDEYMLTLHRTIDAQLVILAYGLSVHNGRYSDLTPPVEHYALALARAINGTEQ